MMVGKNKKKIVGLFQPPSTYTSHGRTVTSTSGTSALRDVSSIYECVWLLLTNYRVYVRNLNEKIKIPVLKEKLTSEFEAFGKILDVVAHKNLRMRGQAFIVFDSVDAAKKAQEGMANREVFGRQIEVQFAKSKSDATIAQSGNEDALEKHRRRRLAAKELRQIEDNKRRKVDGANGATGTGGGATTASSRKHKKDQLDFLPPNKILFLQELPAGVQQDQVEAIFSGFKGFTEVRLMAVRRLGFVEFETDEDAVVAKEATAGLVMDGSAVRITYAKK